jgi:hypothetical protein
MCLSTPTKANRNSRCSRSFDHDLLRYDWYYSSKHSEEINELRPFHAQTFVKLFENVGNIMTVGDSVSELSSFSWRNQFIIQSNLSGSEFCSQTRLPESNLSFYHVRNDLLTIQKLPNIYHEGAFVTLLDSNRIALLILNRGAHYHPDREFLQGVNGTLRYLTSHHPNVRNFRELCFKTQLRNKTSHMIH